MVFDEIVLHNFGVYQGRQTIELAPPSQGQPVVLFGGTNGGGKTTLLDALQLALYGKLARCSNRGNLAYEEFLRQCIHRASDPDEGAAVELKFRHVSDAQEHTYRVHRSWAGNGNGVRERVEVVRDGKFDRVLTDSWYEAVEEFIPARLSHLFFFDGERIEALAEFESSRDLLGTAIHSLLGLDLVDQLGNDLVVLERRKQTELRTGEDRRKIESLQAQIDQLAEQRAELVQHRAAAQNDLDRQEKLLREIQRRFQAEGGDLFSRRQDTEVERSAIEKQLHTLENELREGAAGPAPLRLVADLLQSMEQQDQIEQRACKAEEIAGVLSERDARIMDVARSSGTPQAALLELDRFLSNDRRELAVSGRGQRYLNLDTETRTLLGSLPAGTFAEVESQMARLLQRADNLRRKLVDLDRQLGRTPDGDALAALIDEREQAKLAVEASKRRLELLDATLAQVDREKEQKQANLVAQLEKAVADDFHREDKARIVTHSRRVRDTLGQFRSAIIQRHVRRIEQLIIDSLRQLLRKETLISDLKIDTDTFGLHLYGTDGPLIRPDRLSAGERQLLAVSILWGLARASGRPLPAIIDTPLGRLDTSHRTHLVERYFPYASHQVVLLSTDEEIDERYYQMLRPRVGRAYMLAFDDANRATQVQPGYFV